MNRNDSKWLELFTGINTIIVNNEIEFNKFNKFLYDIGLGHLLKDYKTFSDWQHLAKINNRPTDYLIFEFQIGKGMTFGYTKEDSKSWYGEDPLTVNDLDSFYKNSKLFNKEKVVEELEIERDV